MGRESPLALQIKCLTLLGTLKFQIDFQKPLYVAGFDELACEFQKNLDKVLYAMYPLPIGQVEPKATTSLTFKMLCQA